MTDDQERDVELSVEIRLQTARQTPSPSEPLLNGRSRDAAAPRVFDETRRFRIVHRDSVQSQTFNLSRLWFELCAGTWRFQDTFSTERRHFAVVERVADGRPPRARHLQILEQVLIGHSPKAVAIDRRIAISTVAGAMQASMKRMGLSGRLANAPLMLTMAACAAHHPGPPISGRLTRVDPACDRHLIVSVRRPDLDFPVPLSDAEMAVVRQLVAGRSHAQISGARSTSPRTVANQLATAFRKFGVSGRGALVQRLIAHSANAALPASRGSGPETPRHA